MRLIIPQDIKDMQDKVFPYMHIEKDRENPGWYLNDDAPPEIVEMKHKITKWFEDHDRDN